MLFVMHASELQRLLVQAREQTGCSELALRCDCENLETVYVVDRAGELVVTDCGDTFQYLDLSGDETYAHIDVDRAGMICRRYGADLEDVDAEQYPEVVRTVADQPVKEAVDAVAGAVDELFWAAMREPPDRPRST